MEKKIKLDKERFVRLENEPFIITENESLILSFESPYDLSSAVITLKNNDLQKTYTFAKEFEVPAEFLFGGRLYISVAMYAGDTVVKRWACQPLKLIEADNSVTVFNELDLLTSRIAAAETGVAELKQTLHNYSAVISKINELAEKQNEIVETIAEIKEIIGE